MDTPTLVCQNERRRQDVRRSTALNGLKYLKVSEDRETLTVYLLQKASESLQQEFIKSHAKNHILIRGEQNAVAVQAVNVELYHDEDPAFADYLLITVDQPGDLSVYILRLVALDDNNQPTEDTMSGFDDRYARLKFRFISYQSTALNGLDYLDVSEDVSEDQLTLTVYLLQKATPELASELRKEDAKRRIVFSGGRRIPGNQIVVENLMFPEIKDPRLDDQLVITLKNAGDFSTYTLNLVELDESGRPTTEPMEGIDPRYYQLEFSFKAHCPTDLDCKNERICPPEKRIQPEINYLAKDYASFRQLILDRLSQIMPGWKERHIPDIGIALTEIFAYVGDYLSYYQDAVATEAYLNTARQRISVRRHARLVDYPMHEGCNARTWVCVKTNTEVNFDPAEIYFITRLDKIDEGKVLKHEDLQNLPSRPFNVFKPLIEKPEAQLLTLDDLKNPTSLVLKLKKTQNPLSRYIRDQLSKETRKLLKKYDGTQLPSKIFLQILIKELNQQIQKRSLYSKKRFNDVSLKDETRKLNEQQPRGKDLVRLNRCLLEEAFWEEIIWCQRNSLYFYPAHNTIGFYTWGDTECCLPRGATSATLWDVDYETERIDPNPFHPGNVLQLRVGDVLIFEEILGPETGNPADADLSHRHAVRLTRVHYTVDPMNQEPVVEIEWDTEDALPFPLCISTVGPAPECELIENISVASGNVVLVDHGQSITEFLGRVQLKTETLKCMREGRPEDAILTPDVFRPQLKNNQLTFSQTLPPKASAAKLLRQNVEEARPHIKLKCSFVKPWGEVEKSEWLPKSDLMSSEPEDRHFVVEMNNEGIALLRFGDGESGRQPEVGESFIAEYRIGNGIAGLIGTEAISHVVLYTTLNSGLKMSPRNPVAAVGAINPEPIADVKLLAPTAFRKRLERAITPDDYVDLVKQRHPRIQKAAATLRWTGSWYEMLVALDPVAGIEAEDELLEEIRIDLQHFRRMGHDLRVERAKFVPLDIKMEICVLPGYLRGHMKAELLNVFSNKVLSNGTLGFFHPDNFTFGQAVLLSNIYAAAQSVTGVESVNVTRFERLFEGDNKELENYILPISPLEIVRMDNDPNFPEYGRLELIIGGGR